MTVLVMYAPRVVPARRAGGDPGLIDGRHRRYGIPWESAGKDDIEIYEIARDANAAERRRERVRPQDYEIRYNKQFRSPINESGNVTITRPHPDWVTHVSIERNTLIDQTVDLKRWSAFNGRMLEYALDKHTMIAQELVQRKCTAVTSIPITQEITFSAYDDLKASVVNFAVNKLLTILWEIKQTAVDCKDDVENA